MDGPGGHDERHQPQSAEAAPWEPPLEAANGAYSR
jgi:hypothetical protein